MSIVKKKISKSSLGIALVIVAVGILTALLGNISLLLILLIFVTVLGLAYFFSDFETSILFLLIIRSALDLFSDKQLPAVFGVGIECLVLIYIPIQLLRGKVVRTDKFWWFFLSWTILQGLWLVFMLLGSLGFDASYLSESLREWIRLLLWPSIYFLVMQLQGKMRPQKIVMAMLLSLPFPILVALPQLQSGSLRLKSSFAHANAFASFLLLFMGLIWWQFNRTHSKKWIWGSVLAVLAFFLVNTKALFVLMMLLISIFVIIVPKISISKLLGGLLIFSLVIGLFANSEYGQERLESILNTPLANPEISVSRGILLSESDHNSFNWRLSQWNTVLKAWEQYPTLGYGLGLSKQAINSKLLPHNDYIRALAENGVVGLLTFLGLFIAFLMRSIQMYKSAVNKPQKDLCMILIALIISTLVGMTTENIWSHTVFFFYLSSLMAISGWDWDESEYV